MLRKLFKSMVGPWSTVSNLCYFLTGYFYLTSSIIMVSLSGLWMMFLGVASGGFHWTKKRIWQQLDVGAIYGTLWFIIYSLIHTIAPDISLWLLVPIASAKGLLMTLWKDEFDSMKTVPMLYLLILVLGIIAYPGARVWVATGLFLIGSACQFIGERLYPEYKDQLHAAWHLFTNSGFAVLLYGIG